MELRVHQELTHVHSRMNSRRRTIRENNHPLMITATALFNGGDTHSWYIQEPNFIIAIHLIFNVSPLFYPGSKPQLVKQAVGAC